MPSQTTTEGKVAARLTPARLLFLAAALLVLLWLGLKAWRIGATIRSLQARQTQAEELLSQGAAGVDPEEAEQLVLGIRSDVAVLVSELEPFLAIAPYLGWLPGIGDIAVAAPHLMEMADAGTQAGVFAFRGVKPVLVLMQQPNELSDLRFADLITTLDAAEPELVQASLHLNRVVSAREKLAAVDTLPWRVRVLIEQLDEWLPLGDAGLKLVRILPELVPEDAKRQYLIIAQNEDEMRPTGGFVSAVGIVTFENGDVMDLDFKDAYEVDNWQNQPYELPPRPLLDLMGLEMFLFRDANFWPDFPRSATALMELYQYGQGGERIDGLIAVDQRFVQLLLEATGPIEVSATQELLDSNNIFDRFRESWSFQGDPETAEWAEWFRNRKAFVGTFANSIMSKFQSDLSSIDPVLLAKNMFEAANTKHLQLYVRDPSVAAVVSDLGWDGRLEPGNARDLLMVVDTNVGYSKANIFMERSLDYQVDLSANSPHAQLAVSYSHAGSDDGSPCQQNPSYEFDVVADYLNLANECYWNYLRVYTPEGSDLLNSSQHEVPVETLLAGSGWQGPARDASDIEGVATFANFLVVPRGSNVVSTYRYRLPPTVIRAVADHSRYELQVFKQAGMGPERLTATVKLPEGTQLIDALPAPTDVEGGAVRFELILESDSGIVLDYR